MAIVTAYVYSPVGGIITGRDNYCMDQGQCDSNPCTGDHGSHDTCKSGFDSPVDIDAFDGEDVVLYVNYPTVKSVKTFVDTHCCCGGSNEYAQSVEVALYGDYGADCYIGSVLYGHIESPVVFDNHVYDLNDGSLTLGDAPSGTHQCGGDTCYSGSHSHMEKDGGSVQAPCCCTDTTKGTTVIYSFTFDNNLC